ncbi:hypothetical protein NMK54_12355 [Nocardia otitidiscaviarum]|uniref:hypothetical protein n=1 Tax=Nocardia otitidiscaviarum TaxID=1823 RepID=UPI001FD591ED|nr:hypothetical protein [Nocardia otitidiscaviarum]MCP9620946.1 hypothetical protein [Nocardia otitidiscaviarum]
MTARVGAVHLGWDVVTAAAGGGGTPIRPVQVEGTYTPPAYLLADSSGRLHTAGVDRRPDVGIAISDVRDIIGHPQIVVAGATWPAELVFRARLFNPLAGIGKHLGGAPAVVALPFPDDWPDPKVDEYARLVEQLGVIVEPLPESVALSGYVRALNLVRGPEPGPVVGATGVYSDGRGCLVVAVHGDDEEPTESMGLTIHPEALHDARAADNVVIEVMAAARTIGADTSTVLLTGNIAFNDALRLAFQNHLGHRLQVADHPMHALVLGATHLLANDIEADEYAPDPRLTQPAPGQPGYAQPGGAAAGQRGSSESGSGATAIGQQAVAAADQQAGAAVAGQVGHGTVANPAGAADGAQVASGGGARSASGGIDPAEGQTRRMTQAEAAQLAAQGHAAAAQGQDGTPSNPPSGEVPIASQSARGLPPGLANVGGRFTRPPGTPADDQMTAVVGRQPQAGQTAGQGNSPSGSAGQPGAAAGQGYSGQTPGQQQSGAGNSPAGQDYSGQGYPGQAAGPYSPGQSTGPHGQVPAAPGPGSGYGQASGAPGQNAPYGQAAPGQGTGPHGQVAPGQSAGSHGQAAAGQSTGPHGQVAPGQGYGAGGVPGGYGQPGQYGPGGGGYGPHGPGGTSAGTGAGQGGAMYGGPMPSSGPQSPHPLSPDRDADSSDRDAAEGDRKRKGLWRKMKGKR